MRRVAKAWRWVAGERGQVLPLIALSAVVLIGFTGLAIDLGRVWVAKQELQKAVDAAALAAGQQLPDSTKAYAAATKYSGTSGPNALDGWGVSSPANALTVTFECLSHGPNYTAGSTPTCLTDTSGKNCEPTGDSSAPQPAGVTTCNAVKVTETATVKTGLLSLFIPSFNLSSSSVAAAPSTTSVPAPENTVVILDTTGSMESPCDATVTGISSPFSPDKLDCAKDGVRSLLQTLDPCNPSLMSSSGCGSDVSGTTNVASPLDEAGIVVFPALSGTLTASGSNYNLTTPSSSSTVMKDETDCNTTSTDGLTSAVSDTYPPWQTYTYSSTGTAGGIPIGYPTPYSKKSGSKVIAATSQYFDNFSGYDVIPLSSDYRGATASSTGLSTSANIVNSVDWAKCPAFTYGSGKNAVKYPAGSYPGGDYYGIKDISGQNSYLAGAITEAQYMLATAPTRTVNGKPVTNAIIILSDGELNEPKSASDGVAPGQTGNISFTDTTPCEDAIQAAAQAKAAGTTVYTIAYDSSGNCTDSGNGGVNIAATTEMQDLSSNATTDYYSQTNATSLTSIFSQYATDIVGSSNSNMIPDCTQAPPNC